MKRPAVIPIICFLAGILVETRHCLVFTLPLLLATLIFIYKRRLIPILICLVFFSLGALRYGAVVTSKENDIENYAATPAKKVVISGVVLDVPERKDTLSSRRLSFSFKVEAVYLDDKKNAAQGTLVVSLRDPDAKNPIYIGDRLSIQGKLSIPSGKKNPAGFDYKRHLESQGIRAIFSSSSKDILTKTGVQKELITSFLRFLSRLRNESLAVMERYLSEKTAAVIEPLILGIRPLQEEGTSEVFEKTGTMHIFAVSGLHIGIVALMIMGLCRVLRCPEKAAYLLTIVGICVFAVFAGGRPSSARAAILGSFIILGLLLGRKTDLVNALLFSAFLITLFQPVQIFRIGFILSYLAVLSIIYIMPLIDSLLRVTFGPGIKRFFLRTVSSSFSVWIGIAPVISSSFHIITPSIIFANLLAVPLLMVMIGLGFLLLLTGAIGFLQPAAIFTAFLLDGIARFLVGSMRVISEVPFAYVRTASLSGILMFLFYAVLIAVVIAARRTQRQKSLVVIFILFAANVFVWNEAVKKPPNFTSVTFFDVGKADACLLEFPDGGTMLVDTGSSGKWRGVDAGRKILAPYLWQKGIRRVDCILITHSHDDHAGGLPYIMKNFQIEKIIAGNSGFLDGCLAVERGDIISGFPGMDFFVLNPPRNAMSYGNLNDDSVVVKAVTEKGDSILFCADITASAMKDILRFGTLLKSDLIKIPHHGSGIEDMFLMENFLRMTESKTAVITNKNAQNVDKRLIKLLNKNKTQPHITGQTGAYVDVST
ncbi:MAG: DNA internalization-related competence protein ComEC/Rec2 [Candidatus Omnitrophota bacterium]